MICASALRAAATAGLIVALARGAAAEDAPDAERLYDEGRALLSAGKPAEACAKFEQSLAKDPRQVGVLMNLGLCNERSGKIATALQLYREALDRAIEANLAGVRAKAFAEIDRLALEVPVLTLVHAGAPAPGEKLVVDDVVVPRDRTALPLDPGRHSVVVTAPGRIPFATTIVLARAQCEQLTIPALEAPQHTVIVAGAWSRRLAGKLLTVTGAAAVLTAGGLALHARRDYDALFTGSAPHCGQFPDVHGQATCDGIGQSRSARDHTLGTAALITGAAGVAVALTGVALWLTAPTDMRIAPALTRTTAGVTLSGSF